MGASGPVLQISPISPTSVINFGPVLLTKSYEFFLTLTNIGNALLTITSISITPVVGGVNDFTIVSSIPTTLAAGASTTLEIKFAPTGGASTNESALLIFTTNSVSGVSQFTLEGVSVDGTYDFLQLEQYDPTNTFLINPTVAFGILQSGIAAVSNNLKIVNTTARSQTATLTALTAKGYSIINQVGTNPIAANGSITFNLQLIAGANLPSQDDLDAVVITVPSQTETTNFEATYSTESITPAYPIGNTDQEMLLAFYNTSGQVTLMQANAADLDTEEDCSASRQHDFEAPDSNKTHERTLVRYERLGQVTFSLTISTVDPTGQTSVTTTQVTEDAVDGLLNQILFDGSITGQIVNIVISRAANAGPLSIATYTPYVDVRGEVIEAT